MVQGLFRLVPNLVLGLLVLTIFYFVAKWVRTFSKAITDRYGLAHGAGQVLGRLSQVVVVILGLLVTLSIVLPTFRAGDLIQLLGIGSVAIGFAFRDIFQNFLAGILLLLTQPFRIGDQIIFSGFEGTVEDIQTRATLIRTYDGRRAVIPNASLFTNAVLVNTAFSQRRSEYEWSVGGDADVEREKRAALDAMQSVEGVLNEPPPDVLAVSFDEKLVKLRARWWSAPRQQTTTETQDQVISAILRNLAAARASASPASDNQSGQAVASGTKSNVAGGRP